MRCLYYYAIFAITPYFIIINSHCWYYIIYYYIDYCLLIDCRHWYFRRWYITPLLPPLRQRWLPPLMLILRFAIILLHIYWCHYFATEAYFIMLYDIDYIYWAAITLKIFHLMLSDYCFIYYFRRRRQLSLIDDDAAYLFIDIYYIITMMRYACLMPLICAPCHFDAADDTPFCHATLWLLTPLFRWWLQICRHFAFIIVFTLYAAIYFIFSLDAIVIGIGLLNICH